MPRAPLSRIPPGDHLPEPGRGARAADLTGLLAGSSLVLSPPWKPTLVYPYYLACFNELAGGPANGFRFLVDSTLDWGQDLKRLRGWLERRQVTEPINLCYFGMADPRFHGIPHVNLPGGYPFERAEASFAVARLPGYLAISASKLQGVYFTPEQRAQWSELLKDARPVDVVGHSIFIFAIGPRSERRPAGAG